MNYKTRLTTDHLGPAATGADLLPFANHFNDVVEREGMSASAWVEYDKHGDPVAVGIEDNRHGHDYHAIDRFIEAVIDGHHGAW
jgi:hypothetical protein